MSISSNSEAAVPAYAAVDSALSSHFLFTNINSNADFNATHLAMLPADLVVCTLTYDCDTGAVVASRARSNGEPCVAIRSSLRYGCIDNSLMTEPRLSPLAFPPTVPVFLPHFPHQSLLPRGPAHSAGF